MKKETTLVVSYDLGGFIHQLNAFFNTLGHYKLFDVQYVNERNADKYCAIIIHQKIN